MIQLLLRLVLGIAFMGYGVSIGINKFLPNAAESTRIYGVIMFFIGLVIFVRAVSDPRVEPAEDNTRP